MKVLRVKDIAQINKLLVKRSNNLIVPVQDGNADYIIAPEVLQDAAYKDLWDDIAAQTEMIDYVPLTEEKIIQLDSENKLQKLPDPKEETPIKTISNGR